MARFLTTSLSDAVQRWAGRSRYGLPNVMTETTVDDSGLRGASVTISTKAGEVKLMVVGVTAAADATASHAVDEGFRLITLAPEDAAALADEVERLRAQVERLKEGADG